jgi:hypothetical protein
LAYFFLLLFFLFFLIVNTNKYSVFHSHIFSPLVWKIIWSSEVLPKVKHFLWKACVNVVPVTGNLNIRKVAQSPLCPICKEFTESIEHSMFLCPWTRGVWFYISIGYKVDPATISFIDDWFVQVYEQLGVDKLTMKSVLCWIGFTIWSIWTAYGCI